MRFWRQPCLEIQGVAFYGNADNLFKIQKEMMNRVKFIFCSTVDTTSFTSDCTHPFPSFQAFSRHIEDGSSPQEIVRIITLAALGRFLDENPISYLATDGLTCVNIAKE